MPEISLLSPKFPPTLLLSVAILLLCRPASAFMRPAGALIGRSGPLSAPSLRFGASSGVIRGLRPISGVRGGSSSLSMAASPPTTTLAFGAGSEGSAVVIVGKKEALGSAEMARHIPVPKDTLDAMLKDLKPGDKGASASTWSSEGCQSPRKVTIALLPDKATRHNAAFQPHALTTLVRGASGGDGPLSIIAALQEAEDAGPVACAIGKAFPMFNAKSAPQDQDEADAPKDRVVTTEMVVAGTGEPIRDEATMESARVAAAAVRMACRLVDTPPEELNVPDMVKEAEAVAAKHSSSVSVKVIRGEELRDGGYGGMWGVGKGATHPPALVVLTHKPKGGAKGRSVCLVGKGIVFDTGGLSLKISGSMCGMKADMGGAAGMLSAFDAAVELGCESELSLVLCLAENAIGPKALRNDDVIKCFSGLTVEINNTDAEGRLVLADGVAHAVKVIKSDLVVDMATLTGAQLITTGKKHAGILTNSEGVEKEAVKAGLRSGDLVYPMLYCPELLKDEFSSKVADMKNSVKDRMNAQSSCAGHFIESHLGKSFSNEWLHIDMAGPSFLEDRGTGYGVALLLSLLKAKGFE